VSDWVLLIEGFLIGFTLAALLHHRPRRGRRPTHPEARVFGAEGWVFSDDGTKASWGGRPASGYFHFSSISVVSPNENAQVTLAPPPERPSLRLVTERELLDDCTELPGCKAELHLSTCPEKRSA